MLLWTDFSKCSYVSVRLPFQLLSPVLHDRQRAQHQERTFVPESSWHVHQQRDRLKGGGNNYDYNFLTCDIQSTCCRKTSLWKCFKGLTVLCSISFGKYLSCRNDLNDYSGKCPSDFSKAKGDRVIILLVLSKILHLYFIIIEKFWGFGLKNMFIFLLIDQSNSFKTV